MGSVKLAKTWKRKIHQTWDKEKKYRMSNGELGVTEIR